MATTLAFGIAAASSLARASRSLAALLAWQPETTSYELLDVNLSGGASDTDLDRRITDYLRDHSPAATKHVKKNVRGTNDRIVERLRVGVDEGRFDSYEGPRKAVMWLIRSSDLADVSPDMSGHVTEETQ